MHGVIPFAGYPKITEHQIMSGAVRLIRDSQSIALSISALVSGKSFKHTHRAKLFFGNSAILERPESGAFFRVE